MIEKVYVKWEEVNLLIEVEEKSIRKIEFIALDKVGKNPEGKLFEKIERELLEYLQGKRKIFTLKISIEGTEFQKKVWRELLRIPYGQKKSYGEIAKAIENPRGARAVGMACNKNKIPIIIPCHRVVGSNQKLVGFAGGLEIKSILLNLEDENKKRREDV